MAFHRVTNSAGQELIPKPEPQGQTGANRGRPAAIPSASKATTLELHAAAWSELHRARGRGERELELGLGGALGGAWPLQSATSCFFVQTLPVSPPSDMMAAVTPAPKTYKTPARPRRSLKHAQMPSKPFPTPSTHMHMQQPPSTAYRLVGCWHRRREPFTAAATAAALAMAAAATARRPSVAAPSEPFACPRLRPD